MGRYFKRLSQILVIFFITLYCLIWLLSPVIIRYSVNTYGLPKPLALTADSNIRYNPFTAHLTISNLNVKLNEDSSALKLSSLDAELDLHQLLFDEIYIAEFSVDGIFIPITINDTSLNVAGFELKNENKDVNPDVALKESPEPEFPYQVIIPKFTLKNANIDLQHFEKQHIIKLDTFTLQDILLSNTQQAIHLQLVSSLNGAPINVKIDGGLLKQQGQVNVELRADDIDLNVASSFFPPSITDLSGKVSYTSKFNVVLEKDQTLIEINELRLGLNNLILQQEEMTFAVKKQIIQVNQQTTKPKQENTFTIAINEQQTDVNIPDLLWSINGMQAKKNDIMLDVESQSFHAVKSVFSLPLGQAPIINSTLDITLDGISATSIESNALLADLTNVSATNINFSLAEEQPKANIDTIKISGSEFSKNLAEKMPALAAFDELLIKDTAFSPTRLSINDISLAGLKSHILLNKDKQMSTLVNVNSPSSRNDPNINNAIASSKEASEITDNEPVTTNERLEPAKFSFKLGMFSIANEAQIEFKDSSVKPHYERSVNLKHFTLTGLDTAVPEQQMDLVMKGNSDKYASFDIHGRGTPLAIERKLQVKAVIKELSLPSISSYIKHALKYEIESGQLDLTLDAGILGNKLNGDIDLLLRGVEFTAADEPERDVVTQGFSVPFNVALGMLKDSDGNVELSLPLKGDTSSPSFGLSGLLTLLVKQATMSAAKDYLITTFVPYASVMKVAMAAGEFALKLRINDLSYPAGATELNLEQIEFSRQMSVMLADRKSVNVKLCAVSTASDLNLADKSQLKQADNIERLHALSKQRVENFKAYLVDELNVSSSRLLFCTPQIDSSNEAKARIKFVI